jgi:L-2-hydroxyglutarate oxidase LhgO
MSKAISTALSKHADKERVKAALKAVLLRDYSDVVDCLINDDPRSVITSNIKETLAMLKHSKSDKSRNAKAIIESAALGSNLPQHQAVEVLGVRRQVVLNARKRNEDVNNMETAQAKAAALHAQARWVHAGHMPLMCSVLHVVRFS